MNDPLSVPLDVTPLERDLWPLVAEAERRAGIDARLPGGRRLLVTADPLAQAFTCVLVSSAGQVTAAYAVTALDLAAAFAHAHSHSHTFYRS